ncbi:MAG TPA: hypothetical protein VFQ61_17285 [Polyangiaceae bacterium]|nr:hypothetical protein [Polyangiaceae bacterium]
MMSISSKSRVLRWGVLAFLLSSCAKDAQRRESSAPSAAVGAPGTAAPQRASAAVTLKCPPEAPSAGPIPIQVTLNADARTYWDNQGVLDNALEVLLIRRDQPGLISIAKVDPDAMMLPQSPPRGRPSDAELASDRARIIEQKQYDLLAYGRAHPGAGDYFVVATFADAWTGPTELRIKDAAGPMAPDPASAQLALAEAGDAPIPAAPSATGTVRVSERAAVVGAFREIATSSEPVLTIVLARLRSSGGVLTRQYRLTLQHDKRDLIGTFSVPLASLSAPNPAPSGRHVLFVFVGNQSATPNVIEVP